jgi:adenosylcobinamide-GDP ribazoletransferase
VDRDLKELLLAFQFLTIIPITVKGDISGNEVSRSAVFFPLVGAFQGALAVGAVHLSAGLFGVEIAPAIALLILAASNGGFHLDGLADTFDALAVKSSGDDASDIGRRLSVMKDGSTGPIGVMSIVFAVLLKFLLLKGLLLGLTRPAFYAFLLLMPVYSKWAMVPPMYHGSPARKDGLGKIFTGRTSIGTVVLSSCMTIIVSAFVYVLLLRGEYGPSITPLPFVSLALLYLFGLLSAKYCTGKFGGVTGDVFGAISEISEIFCLMGVSAWLLRSA